MRLTALLLIFFFIASVTAVEWSATQDGFEITAPDIVCTGSQCFIPVRVCNLENTERDYAVSLVAERAQPSVMQILDEEEYFELVPVYVNQLVFNETTEINETIKFFDSYQSVTKTRPLWSRTKDNSLTKDLRGRNKFQSNDITFTNEECKEILFTVQNVIGGKWKYDVNFLDPFINATHYEIGTLTNNSNNQRFCSSHYEAYDIINITILPTNTAETQ